MHPRRRFTVPLPGGRSLALGERTLVMGIINVTPDSFSDGGELLDPERAVEAGVRMAAEGADLLDVGGESTRPGAQPLSERDERRRVLPVIEELVKRVSIPVSIDTYKAAVADAALSCRRRDGQRRQRAALRAGARRLSSPGTARRWC